MIPVGMSHDKFKERILLAALVFFLLVVPTIWLGVRIMRSAEAVIDRAAQHRRQTYEALSGSGCRSPEDAESSRLDP